MSAFGAVRFLARCKKNVRLLFLANYPRFCAGRCPKNGCVSYVCSGRHWNESLFVTYISPEIKEAADKSMGSCSKLSENDHTALVSNLCRASERDDFRLSCQIFKELLLFGTPLSSSCYLNLARAFIKTDDCSYLLQFIKEISTGLSTISTVLNRIILAFAESRQTDKVLQIFDMLKDSECKPDLVTYNTILDILGRSGGMSRMMQIFASMKEDNVIPDIITYNTLLNGLKKIGRLDMCLVVYKEMCKSGIQPDLLTYTAMIDSFGRSGNIEESLRLFNDMKQSQIRPSIYIYRTLIDSLKKLGKGELAMRFLEEMNSSSADLARPEDFKRRRDPFYP